MAAQAKIVSRSTQSAPITALVQLPGTPFALAGQATHLVLLDLASTSEKREQRHKWRAFERERVHRVVNKVIEPGRRYLALVLGGREAVLAQIVVGEAEPTLDVLARLELDDFVGDGAFLDDDTLFLSTLHNSLKVFQLPSFVSPSSAAPPSLAPLLTFHAPLRPVLWCTRFSSLSYTSSASEGAGHGQVRVAGGTMWGDVYLWDVGTAEELRAMAVEAEQQGERKDRESRREGGLRRFVGHKGSIFATSFSPSSSPTLRLATGSDDRTLRLWTVPPFSPSVSLEADNRPPVVVTEGEDREAECETLWGHEGRVWRAECTAKGEVFSVGEDATCRLWSPSASSSVSPSSASPLQSSSYALARTFRSGHDGRSIWSVAPVSLPPSTASDAEGGFEGVLTGGADGGVRCWALPSAHACVMGADVGRGQEAPAVGKGKGKKEDKGGRMKSFAVAAAGGGREVVAAMTLDGSFYLYHAPPLSPASPASSIALPSLSTSCKPCHISAAFAGSSTAAILSLLPSRSNPDELRFFAFSNRGAFVCASVCLAPRDGADAEVQVSDVSECEIPLKVAEVGFLPPAMATAQGMDARATRVAIWDRAGWRLGVLDLPEPTSPAVVPFLIASLALDRSHPAPTSIAFLSPTLLLVGLASGGVELYSLPSSGASTSHNDPPPLVPLASLERVHADGVSDIAVVAAPLSVTPSSGGEQLWELQTVGRDGKRCSLDVALRSGEAGEQEGRIEKVDERALAKGVVEKILPPLERCQRNTRRYLAFVDTRAVVLDELARTLYSFANTGKRAPSQLVSHACGSYSYYRLLSGELHRQYTLPSVSAPPPALLPPLHGREIRAVKSLKTLDGRTLLATGTENGVLSISEVSSCNSLSTLFTNPLLPSSFKSLAWSSSASSTSALLFACGTRELLCAFRVTLVPFPSEGRGGLRVLPAGMVLADEGEEIRTMDMALIPLGKDGETGVLAVYSDGRLKLWSHRLSPSLAESEMDSFALLAATTEHAKCVLTVEAVEVEVEGKKRRVVVTGSSNGLLALRDLTPLLDSDGTSDTISPDLPAPFCTFCPHQSGINALAIHAEGTSLVFATAGDDNAVSVQRLHLFLLNEALAAELGPSATLEDAHASTIQGLDFLAPSFLVSSSVEQRLNAYSLCLRSGASLPAPPTIQIIDSTCLDVADCSAQELLEEKGGRRRVVVAGIGMQVVELTMEAA